jgi:hypothetical protein
MRDPNNPDIILMRHLGTLEPEDLTIQAGNEGVTRFVPDLPFGHPNDFRWLIDLAGPNFHDCDVVIDGTGTEPNVIIKDGLFYTAARTDESKLRVTRNGGGKNPLPLGAVAAIVGVNIYLRGQKLTLTWTQDGEEETLILPLSDAPPNVSDYEIRIVNDPPYVDPESDVSDHDEFKEYYKVVEKLIIDGNDVEDFPHFKLKFEKLRRPGLGSPTIPCMPIGNGTG